MGAISWTKGAPEARQQGYFLIQLDTGGVYIATNFGDGLGFAEDPVGGSQADILSECIQAHAVINRY